MGEVRLFFSALTFYTRLPVLRWADHDDTALSRATRYLPLVGVIVGAVAAAVWWMAQLALPATVAIVLSMAATVCLTGAFHEDGLADVCDGFGGGWTPAQVLQIMKDSRVGAYGVVGLSLALLLKAVTLASLPAALLPVALIVGHTVSRWVPVITIAVLPYARRDATSKVRPVARGVSAGGLTVATVVGLTPLAALVWLARAGAGGPAWAAPLTMAWGAPPAWALAPVVVAGLFMGWRFRRRLGGYTGDCLGAQQQVCELAAYLGICACASS